MFERLQSIFEVDITLCDSNTLRSYRTTLLGAQETYRAIRASYHSTHSERHTSQCQCGLSYEEWSMYDYASDVLTDIEALLR